MAGSHYQNLESYCAEGTANDAQYNEYNKPRRNQTRKFERGVGIWRYQSKDLSNTPKSRYKGDKTRNTEEGGIFSPLLFEGYKFSHNACRQSCQHCIIALLGLWLFLYHAYLAFILLIVACVLKERGSSPGRIIIFSLPLQSDYITFKSARNIRVLWLVSSPIAVLRH